MEIIVSRQTSDCKAVSTQQSAFSLETASSFICTSNTDIGVKTELRRFWASLKRAG